VGIRNSESGIREKQKQRFEPQIKADKSRLNPKQTITPVDGVHPSMKIGYEKSRMGEAFFQGFSQSNHLPYMLRPYRNTLIDGLFSKQTAMGGWIRGRPQLRMKIPGSRAASRLISG